MLGGAESTGLAEGLLVATVAVAATAIGVDGIVDGGGALAVTVGRTACGATDATDATGASEAIAGVAAAAGCGGSRSRNHALAPMTTSDNATNP